MASVSQRPCARAARRGQVAVSGAAGVLEGPVVVCRLSSSRKKVSDRGDANRNRLNETRARAVCDGRSAGELRTQRALRPARGCVAR